jgi:guanylate cyclase
VRPAKQEERRRAAETEDRDTATGSRSFIERVSTIGHQPTDSRGVRTRKTTLVVTTLIGAVVVIPWGLFYISIGLVLTGMIPLVYATLSAIGIAHFQRTQDDRFLRYEQIVLFLVLPVLVHVTLGGFVNSSGVVMYSIIGVLGGVTSADAKRGWLWFAAYSAFVFVLIPLDPIFRTWAPELSANFIATLLAINILTVSLLVYLFTLVYVQARSRLAAQLAEERERSERLLLNVLPASIAARLIDGEQPIADRYDEVAVLFADIVDFTPLSEGMSADDLVAGLNGVFSAFDDLAAAHGVEKIKTIGDAYMVVSGAPHPGADVNVLADLALRMRASASSQSIGDRAGIAMRFGMDVGPVIAGVIGESKFIYDVYGDTVNMASRMESTGVTNRIQITERVVSQLNERFEITERGPLEVKGKGMVTTYFLDGPES